MYNNYRRHVRKHRENEGCLVIWEWEWDDSSEIDRVTETSFDDDSDCQTSNLIMTWILIQSQDLLQFQNNLNNPKYIQLLSSV